MTVKGEAGNLVGKVSRDLGSVDEWGCGTTDRDFLEGAENLGDYAGDLRRRVLFMSSVCSGLRKIYLPYRLHLQ